MHFHADIHVHSKYSHASSKNADIEHLALWARKKGIVVIGTGDFTHPAWLAEIKEKLIPAEEPGLLRLNPEFQKRIDAISPKACLDNPVRFMLEVEVATIYKKWDRFRKIHHLVFVPDLQTADRLIERLSKFGNIASDGRPTLKLDSRDLLEIVLDTGPHSYLIPAHIWTPWFAALGFKSGFDSIDNCYEDLTQYVFAVETGLSSTPPMNWRLSSLDRFRLVSNSDAHSPEKIAREVTNYDTDIDYFAMLHSLKTGEGFAGTIEFYPEEGKYYMDGHRNCNICFTLEETKIHNGLCPICGKALTIGVFHRINALADRTEGEILKKPPPNAKPMRCLVPLPKILAEIKGVGVKSKTVTQGYSKLLRKLGPELYILEHAPLDDIGKVESSLLVEAISRLRQGKVSRYPGYDGKYGVIRMLQSGQ